MSIGNIVLKPFINKLKKEVKKETGYEVDITFNDPISFKIRDGAARLHVNTDVTIDAALIMKLIEGEAF